MLSSTHQVTWESTDSFVFATLIRDKLNTRNLLRTKNMELDDYNYVLYNASHEETSFHLFFECAFSQACWNTISISWNLSLPTLDMVIDARLNFGNPIFREICITACWVIWTMRNAVIFDNAQFSIIDWKRCFKEELDQVCTKAKPSRQSQLNIWKIVTLFDCLFLFGSCKPCIFLLLVFSFLYML